MTIEEYFVAYLNDQLSAPVSGNVPPNPPAQYVTVELVGRGAENQVDSATISVESYANSRAEAGQLNHAVISAMEAAIERPEISSCRLDTAYNFTDTASKKDRYRAIFEVVFFL